MGSVRVPLENGIIADLDIEKTGRDDYRFTRTWWDTEGPALREHNSELRKAEGLGEDAMGGLIGRWALSMNELDRYTVGKMFPGINSFDAEERSKEWVRFLKSPLSAPYKVRDDKW